MSTAITDGPGCLMLRCPDPTCGAAVGQDMINLLASNEDKQKYSRYFLRSYIEDNRKVILCLKPSNQILSHITRVNVSRPGCFIFIC